MGNLWNSVRPCGGRPSGPVSVAQEGGCSWENGQTPQTPAPDIAPAPRTQCLSPWHRRHCSHCTGGNRGSGPLTQALRLSVPPTWRGEVSSSRPEARAALSALRSGEQGANVAAILTLQPLPMSKQTGSGLPVLRGAWRGQGTSLQGAEPRQPQGKGGLGRAGLRPGKEPACCQESPERGAHLHLEGLIDRAAQSGYIF